MREFRAYEYVDGDVKVYVREKGQGDDKWREAGTIPWEYGDHGTETTARARLGITDLTKPEQEQLAQELTRPRRW